MALENGLKELKKEIKDWGYNINISRTELKVSISRDRRSFISKAKEVSGYLHFSYKTRGYNTYEFKSEEAFNFLLKYWKIYAKMHNYAGVFVDERGYIVNEGAKYTSYRTINEILEKYEHIDTNLLKKYKQSSCLFDETYMLDFSPERTEKILESTVTMLKCLEEIQHKEDIVKFIVHWSYNFPVQFPESFSLYYNGAEKHIILKETEKGMECIFKDQKTKKCVSFFFTSKEELQEKTAEQLLKIKQQQKIRNLYEPPKKMFDEKMSYQLYLSSDDANLIYESLRNYYKPEQIEKKMCNSPIIKQLYSYNVDRTREDVKIFQILSHYFVFNHKTKELKEAKEQIEAYQLAEEFILRSYQKHIGHLMSVEKRKLYS